MIAADRPVSMLADVGQARARMRPIIDDIAQADQALVGKSTMRTVSNNRLINQSLILDELVSL